MRKPKVVLNNWYVAGFDDTWVDAYTPPEAVRLCLAGEVVGHPRFADGHFIKSSPIIGGPLSIRDGMIIETENTLYMLEGVCPKYKVWCDANAYSVST